jgi:hypothetical protein
MLPPSPLVSLTRLELTKGRSEISINAMPAADSTIADSRRSPGVMMPGRAKSRPCCSGESAARRKGLEG